MIKEQNKGKKVDQNVVFLRKSNRSQHAFIEEKSTGKFIEDILSIFVFFFNNYYMQLYKYA